MYLLLGKKKKVLCVRLLIVSSYLQVANHPALILPSPDDTTEQVRSSETLFMTLSDSEC